MVSIAAVLHPKRVRIDTGRQPLTAPVIQGSALEFPAFAQLVNYERKQAEWMGIARLEEALRSLA